MNGTLMTVRLKTDGTFSLVTEATLDELRAEIETLRRERDEAAENAAMMSADRQQDQKRIADLESAVVHAHQENLDDLMEYANHVRGCDGAPLADEPTMCACGLLGRYHGLAEGPTGVTMPRDRRERALEARCDRLEARNAELSAALARIRQGWTPAESRESFAARAVLMAAEALR